MAFALVIGAVACAEADAGRQALQLERTIPLSGVRGRINHMALDPSSERLAVAELENGNVDIIDLARGVVTHRISGLSEPQGIEFDAAGHIIAIATGGDGALHLVSAITFSDIATIHLGDDADDVRIDPRNGHAIVGYGAGALAIIDLASHAVVERISLPAHPESFQIDPQSGRAFVNLPDRRTIGVADLDHATLTDTWRLPFLL